MSMTIVVGVDDAATSQAAVAWAGAEAARRGSPLHLVRAVRHPSQASLFGWSVTGLLERLDADARDVLQAARDLLHLTRPDVEVRTTVLHDHPRDALVAACDGAEMVVTGARRRSDLRAWSLPGPLLGSTSLFVAAHAPCPAVVVRRLPVRGATGVVVGLDDSPAAASALDFAAAEAASLGEELTVVRAWRTPLENSLILDPEELRAASSFLQHSAERAVDAAVQEVRRRHDVQVGRIIAHEAFASDALAAAAARARLLVVGSRGRGAFFTAFLGSTSHALLHRVDTPVAVVPEAARVDLRHRQPSGTQQAVPSA